MTLIPEGAGEYPLVQRHDVEKPSVLIVEDDKLIVEVTREVLERRGYAVTAVSDGLDAIREIAQHDFECIVLDLRMSLFDGEQLVDLLLFDRPSLLRRIIVVSGYSERAEKMRGRVREVFIKPLVRGTLVAAVARCVIAASSVNGGAGPAAAREPLT